MGGKKLDNELKASVQYGDLKGEVACDGFGGPFLSELASDIDLDDTYFPLSLSVYRGESGFLSIYVYACNKDKVGKDIDEIKDYGRKNGSIPVKRFEYTGSIDNLLKKIKRLDILAMNSVVEGISQIVEEE